MKLGIIYNLPSPESRFLISRLSKEHDVDDVPFWNLPAALERTYDLVLAVGPVSACPSAKKKVLLAFGPIMSHYDCGWDAVIVTCPLACEIALSKYGHNMPVFLVRPAILELEAG